MRNTECLRCLCTDLSGLNIGYRFSFVDKIQTKTLSSVDRRTQSKLNVNISIYLHLLESNTYIFTLFSTIFLPKLAHLNIHQLHMLNKHKLVYMFMQLHTLKFTSTLKLHHKSSYSVMRDDLDIDAVGQVGF